MGSMLELEKEVAELKQKLLTHEIATGLILSDIVKLLDIARPGALDALTKNYQAGQAKSQNQLHVMIRTQLMRSRASLKF